MIFAAASIALNVMAGVTYALKGDLARAAYWLLGAAIGAVASFWVK